MHPRVPLVQGISLLVGALTVAAGLDAQQPPPGAASVSSLQWRNIGPAVMGGRVSDLAVVETDPSTFFVATASGGLWRTDNQGASWTPLFDEQATASVGAVAVAPSDPDIVWAGTGEPDNRQSSAWGNGVYRSGDGGRTWQHMGLDETHHIALIRIHPRDPNVVYVAAMGHLWGPNPERGLYRTSDGGRTWEKVLYIDEHTGATDLVMHPTDPQTLYVAMYQRQRTPWGYSGGGPGSGIYRSRDGGRTWTELTRGLPRGDMGRIGLDIYRRDPNLLFAIVEALPSDGRGVYRSTDGGESWEHLNDLNERPMYFSLIRVDPNDPQRVYLAGRPLYVSNDGGRTFSRGGAEGVHVDHHSLWVNPNDPDHLVLGNDGGVYASHDRAKTWRHYNNLTISQFYQIDVDMREPYHVCGGLQDNGTWCGPSATTSSLGILNSDWIRASGGDGYFTRIDPTDPNTIIAEGEAGRVLRADLRTGETQPIRPAPPRTEGGPTSYRFNWNTPILLSSRDPATVYVGTNVLLKSPDRGHTWQEISPDLTRRVDRSRLPIMGVLPGASTLSLHDGTASYSTITEIAESPLNPSVLYVGTDDGNVQRSRDGGATWTNLIDRITGAPQGAWVSGLAASRAREGTVYVALDAHRGDDFRPYLFVSDDFGESWRPIVGGLPQSPIDVVTEHPRTPDLLFVGNEVGVFVSFDRGVRWQPLRNNLPTVPVDDIVVHPRENDLVIGTHGRGVWILPDVAPLEQLTRGMPATTAQLFPPRPVTSFTPHSQQGFHPAEFAAPNPAEGVLIRYLLREERPGATLTVLDAQRRPVRTLNGSGGAGVQQVVWDLRHDAPYETPGAARGGSAPGPRVLPGTYTVRLEAGGETATTEVRVLADPRLRVTQRDLEARQQALLALHGVARPLHEMGLALQALERQVVQRRGAAATEAARREIDAFGAELSALARRLDRGAAREAGQLSSALEEGHFPPTQGQQEQLQGVQEETRRMVDAVNSLLAERVPALNRSLARHGLSGIDAAAIRPIRMPPEG